MTIYQFNRKSGGLVKTKHSLDGYLMLLFWLSLAFIFHVINIPYLAGFNFHFFLFEMVLLYLLIVQNYKIPFFAILFFYSTLDFLDASLIGQSFIAFLLSFGVVYLVKKYIKASVGVFHLNYFTFSLIFLLFIALFTGFKLSILYFMKDAPFGLLSFKYVLKSIIFSFLICLNCSIIFNKLLK